VVDKFRTGNFGVFQLHFYVRKALHRLYEYTSNSFGRAITLNGISLNKISSHLQNHIVFENRDFFKNYNIQKLLKFCLMEIYSYLCGEKIARR